MRYIDNLSNSPEIYRRSTRRIIRRGFDVVRLANDWAEGENFEQDILIKPVNNATDRVWFGYFEEQDASDANEAWLIHNIPTDEYEERFPDGSKHSIDEDRPADKYWHKRESIAIGEYFYKKPYKKTLVLMSSGKVYEQTEEFGLILDELAQAGVKPVRTRDVTCYKVYSRFFDGGDWLGKEMELPFDGIPLVPNFGNFEIIENKILYSGITHKLMDAQRVYNYARSREIEEGALAPRSKFWMTKAQAKGHERQLKSMNTSADPVQFYNPDQESPVPFQTGGAQVNPALAQTAQVSNQDMAEQAGIFSAQQGANPMYQSGEAIKQQISKGDIKTVRWLNHTAVMIRRVTQLAISAMPKVYDTTREIRIINEDGTDDLVTLNETIVDQQTGQQVKVNDPTIGKYDVVITIDQAFKSRRAEAAQRLTDLATVDQSIMLEAGDIVWDSIDIPNADKISERKRQQLLMSGAIPVSQMTEEEQQQMMEAQQAQAQNQQPDAMTIAAQAEMMKAQADLQKAQNDQTRLQIEMMKLQDKSRNTDIVEAKAEADIGKTRADTMLSMAKAEQASQQTVGQQIDNVERVTPQVTVVATAPNESR